MNPINEIVFNILKYKKNLSKKQEDYVIDRIVKHGESKKWLSGLNVRAVTPEICLSAYLKQATDKGKKEICTLTPARCVRKIEDVEYLQDLIKTSYNNYEFIDMDNLRNNDDKFAVAKCAKTYINEMDKMIYSCREVGSRDVSKYEFLKKETYSLYKTELEVYNINCENENNM